MTEVPSESRGGSTRRPPMVALREEMDDLLSRFVGGWDEGWFGGRVTPSFDLSETENAIEVSIDLPGIKPEEIHVQISGNTLTVRGERKEEKTEQGRTFHRIERRRGSFSRAISLPCAVVEDGVIAEYKDGVLNISLPKCDAAKGRRIEVKHT